MTIAQQFLLKKECKQQEEPLVPLEKSPRVKDIEEGKPVVVTMHAHVRRVNSLTTLCAFATALAVLSTGILGGTYLYRHITHYKLHHFRGWCSIPYVPDAEMETKQLQLTSNLRKHFTTYAPKVHYFEEKFDIDVKFGQFERIEVPAFERGRHALFIHDFFANRSGIIDYETRSCFVKVLNPNFVNPPRILVEQVTKMRAGYYDADTRTVRHIFQIRTPPISNWKNEGLIITRDCASMPTYILVPVTSHAIYKRSLGVDKDLFVEFAGNKINEIQIVNLDEVLMQNIN